MSYADSASPDSDVKRYLKHHALLERARTQAHHYLTQTWLHFTRALNRELRSMEVTNRAWVEAFTQENGSCYGVRWNAQTEDGLFALELRDVRSWVNLNGISVACGLIARTPEGRAHLRRRLSPQTLAKALPPEIDVAANLIHHPEGELVASITLPFIFADPRSEANSLLTFAAILWGVIEGDPPARAPMTSIPPPAVRSPLDPPSPAPSPKSSSPQPRPTPPTERPSSRYASAAPLRERAPAPETRPTHEPTYQSERIDNLDPYDDLYMEPEITRTPMPPPLHRPPPSASQAPIDPPSTRLIRQGSRNISVDARSPERFIPRSIPKDKPAPRALPIETSPPSTPKQNAAPTEPTPLPPSAEPDHETQATPEAQRLTTDPSAEPPQSTPSLSLPEETRTAIQKDIEELINVPPESSSAPPVDTASTVPDPFVVTPPSYLKPIKEVLVPSDDEDPSDGGMPVKETGGVDVEALVEALTRCGLPPWRMNAYDSGRGQILWLKNGSHIDLNPAQEVVLGGENQDETRARLSLLGINV